MRILTIEMWFVTMNANIILFVEANVLSFVIQFECGSNSKHTCRNPPRNPSVWFFNFCATFIANKIDLLNCVCAPHGPSHVPLFHCPCPIFNTWRLCLDFSNRVCEYNFNYNRILRTQFQCNTPISIQSHLANAILMASVLFVTVSCERKFSGDSNQRRPKRCSNGRRVRN